MLGANQMLAFIYVSFCDIAYAKQLRMELGYISERQKCHPRVVALHLVTTHGHRYGQRQHLLIGRITGIKANMAKQGMAGRIRLTNGRMGAAWLANGIIEH